MKKKNIIALLLSALLILFLTACGGEENKNPGGDDYITVKVGVVGANNDQWDTVNKLLEKDLIRVEIVEFAEYKLPNDALNAGEIDLNAFQHKAYLNKEIADYGYDITVLCDTIIAPLSLYSDKITSVSELKEGDKIAVPNDPTNEGRCFKILEAQGVLTVDPAAGAIPELKDITSNPLNLEFVEVGAESTYNQLPDVAAAFINGAHASDHGLTPDDAICIETVESGSDNPSINIIACRSADVDNEIYQKVVKAYQSAETAQAIKDIYKGLYIPAFQY
ncbi:MAG: MetQ/NlpA family ABC transporter substrate-binding protein [Oscillospiraceae bacterium]|nr:MetQ/NlpA family ABC transporter substrate-binding protein [Oscillospiraceae bacterium]